MLDLIDVKYSLRTKKIIKNQQFGAIVPYRRQSAYWSISYFVMRKRFDTIKTEGSPRGFSQWPLECLQRVIVDSYGSLFEPLSGFSELLILSEAALSL